MLRLMFPLVAFVMGCALQLQQRELWHAWVYMLFSGLAVVYCAHSAIKSVVNSAAHMRSISAPNQLAGLMILSMAAVCLGFGQAGWRATAYQANALASELEGRDIRMTGVIAAMPQRDESGIRFRLDVESAQLLQDGKTLPVALPARIQLAWYRSLPRLSEDAASVAFAELQAGGEPVAGQRWQLIARLKAPHGNLNPHGFDYELWLWEQGIQATGYVRATPREAARGDAPLKLGETWQHPLEAARQSVRDAIFLRINNAALAGVIAALAVGDQAAIDRADWDVYRATGVAHLMSISGLHITMFAWSMALLVGGLWRRSMLLTVLLPAQHAALMGGVMLATVYALFAGWGLPAQRTIGMLAVVTLLKLSGKRWPWPLVWLVILALIAAFDPWALLSAGFWLSFVAVGVLFASDAGRVDVSYGHNGLNGPASLGRRTLRLLREQWIISLALAPLSLLLFNQVSIIGLLANALAIPWVTLLITPLAMAGSVFAPFWDAAAWGVQMMGVVLAWLASFSFATISIAASAGWIMGAAVFGSILVVMRLPIAMRCAGALMILPMLLVQPSRPGVGEFALLAADIGQGNALLVQTANHSLLYDTGPRFSRESDAGQRTLVPLLRALGEKLDVVMVSHRDADHIGGAAAVLKMQPQASLVSSVEAEHELQTLRPSERCLAGQRWQWDGVRFEILHPAAADYETANKPNAMSCVLHISNGKHSVLLTGDLEAAQEQKLLAQGANLKSDVMLVPHHGSKTSSTPEFLDAVKPRIALVQAGYRNRFQHPVPEVMARYEARSIRVISSTACGAALWKSQNADRLDCQREVAKRYWHHRLP
jgi:competence protein ComEC